MNKLYVGNLKWGVSDEQVEEVFKSAGTVVSVNIILDRETGRSRGFGFVEMSTGEEAKKAIETLNGVDIEGRNIIVKEALPEGAPRIKFEGTMVNPANSFVKKPMIIKCPNCGHEF